MTTPRDQSQDIDIDAKGKADRPFDILVKSSQSPAQEAIPAHSECLAKGSHVFQSMLELGSSAVPNETSSVSENQLPTVEVDERYEILVLLVNQLENPPQLPPATTASTVPSSGDPPGSILPWPLVSTLLDTADKYDFTNDILTLLHAHLQSHASSHPLSVYALASRLGLTSIASYASSFLLHPPMHQYSVSDIKILPSATSYHLLLILQTHRLESLKQTLENELLFPHDYGACSKHGTASAKSVWEARKGVVLNHVDASSSIADMMAYDGETKQQLKNCAECCLGWERAVEMMRYKAGKVIREIGQLPKSGLQ
ncbi:BTB domain protein [Rhizoctonia solani AG-3 Rhs1AP]|uniref:BTB domain protein n=2 Tax=Rhizoctonia solani AG-3 TaxID=1086053 RepID=A0A074S339_9AGAM|nr:BTB domain protein [Rhizoctonia solani AG-3 Rhs1AP]KEP53736.1 BTB domain protein [Rhizoctonia solani 123E]